jgi:hypothetical protein
MPTTAEPVSGGRREYPIRGQTAAPVAERLTILAFLEGDSEIGAACFFS